jgi:hypothetical protein
MGIGLAKRTVSPPYTVFISHAWHDRWVATQLARLIREKSSADVFIDVFDVEYGDRIEERVQEGIVRCSELVALVTPWSVKRTWLWTEIGGAWGSKKRVVGLLYGVTLDEIQKEHGGTACLNATNCGHINDLDAYLEQLTKRAKG